MPLKRKRHSSAFTLVEIMIVVMIIALLAVIGIPSFLRARKRSQATKIKNDLRLIDNALAQYAIETNKKTGDVVYVDDWLDYIKKDTALYNTAQDVLGQDYGDQAVDELPKVHPDTWAMLSDVADSDFWAPYTCASSAPAVHNERHARPTGPAD